MNLQSYTFWSSEPTYIVFAPVSRTNIRLGREGFFNWKHSSFLQSGTKYDQSLKELALFEYLFLSVELPFAISILQP